MRWLRRLWHKSLSERRLDSELRFHLERKLPNISQPASPTTKRAAAPPSNSVVLSASRKSAAKRAGRITWKFLRETSALPFEALQRTATSLLSPFSRWPWESAHPPPSSAW